MHVCAPIFPIDTPTGQTQYWVVSARGCPAPQRLGWRKMATPVHPENGARFTGSLLIGCGCRNSDRRLRTQTARHLATNSATDAGRHHQSSPIPSKTQLDPEAPIEKLPLKSGWIFKSPVNVRSDPSTTAPIITKLSRGAEVKLVEKTDQWWKVQLSDATTRLYP